MDRIKRLVAEAAKEDEAMKNAIAYDRAEKRALLEDLVEILRPSLPSICSRVPAGERGKPEDYGKNVEKWLTDERGAPARAVLVGGSERPKPPLRKVAGLEPLTGSALYLSEHGAFFRVDFEGEFRNVGRPDDGFWWRVATMEHKTIDGVLAERWNVGEIVEYAADELEAAASGKAKATKKATKSAATVREAAAILKGVR